MEIPTAAIALSALGHQPRLELFRLLVRAGREGMAAGEIGRSLGAVQNTVSSYLKILSQAGLIAPRREGRSIIYVADYQQIGALLRFLVEDCCNGDPEACASAFGSIGGSRDCC